MAGGLGRSNSRNAPRRVVRTGIALVHENEIVYPSAGSQAQAVQVVDDTNGDIQVHFPVVFNVGSMDEAPVDNGDNASELALQSIEEEFRRA